MNDTDENKYGYDQFGYPITKEDVKFDAIIGALMGIVFVAGLLVVTFC